MGRLSSWVTRTSDLPPLPSPCCLLLVSLGFLKAVPTAKSHPPPRVLVLAPLPPGTRASYWRALLSLIFWNHPATSDTNIQLWGSRGGQKPKVLSVTLEFIPGLSYPDTRDTGSSLFSVLCGPFLWHALHLGVPEASIPCPSFPLAEEISPLASSPKHHGI